MSATRRHELCELVLLKPIMPKILISRSKEYTNRFRQATIYLDGEKIGSIGNGDTKSFDVPDGKHSLYAKIDWGSSRPLDFSLMGDEKKYFRLSGFRYSNVLTPVTFAIVLVHLVCSSVFGIRWIVLLAIPSFLVLLYYITVAKKDYLLLKETDSW
jgi:hypothetical protein